MADQKEERLLEALDEARRFLRAGQRALARVRVEEKEAAAGRGRCYGMKEMAAAKRASMDLTRALAELRR